MENDFRFQIETFNLFASNYRLYLQVPSCNCITVWQTVFADGYMIHVFIYDSFLIYINIYVNNENCAHLNCSQKNNFFF